MKIKRASRGSRAVVLIPTRGRAALLAKQLAGPMSFLVSGRWSVIFAVAREDDDYNNYVKLFWDLPVTMLSIRDKQGSCGIAREELRRVALSRGVRYAVMTDDNARFTEQSLTNLIRATHDWTHAHGMTFMAGMHGTAAHFDRGKIADQTRYKGLRSYPQIGMIFHCVAMDWLRNYSYPGDCFALEDRHMIFTAIRHGIREFRVCMDAPFTKSRYSEGGQGSIEDRMWKCGKSIERLAHDFPKYVGARGTFPTPWSFIMQMEDGHTADRLPGGAMRTADRLVQQQ
jgi:hypothetical protein